MAVCRGVVGPVLGLVGVFGLVLVWGLGVALAVLGWSCAAVRVPWSQALGDAVLPPRWGNAGR